MRYPSPFRAAEGGVAVFADAHLGDVEGDADDFLAALATLPARGFGTVVFLGDIFRYFIGDERFDTPLTRRVLDGWRELRATGMALRYVEGNRDFFLRGTRFVSSMEAYGETDGLEVGGRRFAFVHGDRVNTSDLPYRFWRRLSKNAVSRAVLRAIPGGLARALVAQTEARLYDSNFKHKNRLPEAALLEEGRRARRAGYEVVLVGHFHVERALSAPDGAAHVLPAWLEERRHAEIAPDGTLTVVEEPTATRSRRRGFGPVAAA